MNKTFESFGKRVDALMSKVEKNLEKQLEGFDQVFSEMAKDMDAVFKEMVEEGKQYKDKTTPLPPLVVTDEERLKISKLINKICDDHASVYYDKVMEVTEEGRSELRRFSNILRGSTK